MNREKLKTIWILITIFPLFFLFNYKLCEGSSKVESNNIISRKDYYIEKVNLGSGNRKSNFQFMIKERGRYAINLMLTEADYYKNHPEGWYNWDKRINLKYRLELSIDDNIIFFDNQSYELVRGDLGRSIYNFNSPSDIPINKKINAQLTIDELEENFFKRYKEITIVIEHRLH